ncbi:MAG: acetate--CoA ligase family protein [Patescibacteria group bacterium]
MEKIEQLVNPSSVAIIGASADSTKIGYQITNNLISGHFVGKIFPVNPKEDKILGLKAYADISLIKEQVDLAVIVIPAQFVLQIIKQCAENHVKSIIIISAGFAEIGEDGEKLQDEIVEVCREAGITMLGPNCLGLINTDAKLNASFAQLMPKEGNISFVSQSGAMIAALIDWSKSASVGFNKIFSMGNKADIREESVLEYLYNDSSTKVIVAYFEQINVNKELTELFVKYSKIKPTIVLFGGKTSLGAKAASSHTGSVISSYLAVETYLKQAGVIVASNLSEIFMYCQLFSNYQKINGDNVAIVTNAGGPGIVTCDELFARNLNLAKLSEKTTELLSKICRPCANINNPVDILGDATKEDYQKTLGVVEADPNINSILVLLTPQSATDALGTAQMIADFSSSKPIISVFIGGENLSEARTVIEKSNKPCYVSPDEAVHSLETLVAFNKNLPKLLPLEKGNDTFNESNKNECLKKFNLPILEYSKVESIDELKKHSLNIGYPVVLKTAKSEIVHKSDSGGVKLNIQNDAELEEAFSELGSPVIIGKMVKGKHEIFLGIKKDPNIGTLVAFGTGGIYSEIYKDLSYRVAPISKNVALDMINETKIGQVLNGARGQDKYDFDKLSEVIVNAAKFADAYENIKEIDFNPLIASYPDFYIVDVRIIEG